MKIIFVISTFCFLRLLEGVLSGAEVWAELSPKDAVEVRSNLLAFEHGELSLEDVVEHRGEEGCYKVAAYYLCYTNVVNPKWELPISRCLDYVGLYAEAERLAKSYTSLYSNDWQGWRAIGDAELLMDHSAAALKSYTNSLQRGDRLSFGKFAVAAYYENRLDLLDPVIPDMLKLQFEHGTETLYRNQLTTALLMYSCYRKRQDIFVKTMAGVDMDEIVEDSALNGFVRNGLAIFSGSEVEIIARRFKEAEMKSRKLNSH